MLRLRPRSRVAKATLSKSGALQIGSSGSQRFLSQRFAELTRFLTCISIGRGVKKALEEQHIIQVRQTKSEMFYEN